MRDGWRETTLGEVTTTVPPSKFDGSARYIGLEHFDSGSPALARWGSTDEVSSMTTGFVSGDVLFSKLRPYLRKVAVPSFDGRCTTESLVYRSSTPDLIQPYLALVLQSAAAIAHADASSAGSRMPRTSVKLMASLPVWVPSLVEQRRIVDLIAALDDAIETSNAIVNSTESLLERLAESTAAAPDPEGQDRVSDVLSRSIGGVWGQEAGTGEVDVVAFRSTEFSNWGDVIHKEPAIRSVTEREFQSRRLKVGDILIEKSGGTPLRPVGRVVQFFGHDLEAKSIGTNFMQIATPDPERVDSRYLFWMLWSWHRRGGSVLFQAASTNIRNLKTKAYLEQRVELPGIEEQQRVAADLDAVADARRTAIASLSELQRLRSNLLTALLSGEHEIPTSYDELIEQAEAA